MCQQQSINAGRDTYRIGDDKFQFKAVSQFSVNQEGLRLAAHCRHNATRAGIQRQIGNDTQHRLFRPSQIMQHARQIIFQILLPLSGEIRNNLNAIDQIRADQAEINHLALSHRTRHQSLRDGLVLGFGKRLRVDNIQLHHAIGCHGDFFQHVAHTLRLNPQARLIGGNILRIIKFKPYRFIKRRHNIARALREGKQAVLGQIKTGISKRQIGKQIKADKNHAEQYQRQSMRSAQ